MIRLAITVISCFLFLVSLAQQPRLRPNIIYIYADDLGYGELGCYGQQKIQTPNLDKLAAAGMRFTNHYTGSPVCAPARAILMTGKHAGHVYIRGNYELGEFADDREGGQMPLPEGTVTIAAMLKKAGYVTGAFGKWGLGMHNTTGDPNQQGFDHFYGYLDQKQSHNFYPTHLWENGKWDTLGNRYFMPHRQIPQGSGDSAFAPFIGKDYSPARITEKTLQFIRKHHNRPFFLYLPYTAPHLSLQAPESEVNAYKGRFDEKPYHGEKGYTPCKYPLSTYAAMITYLDKQVGAVIDLLKELGLDKNTIVMFSSDNGPTFDVGGVDSRYFNSSGGLRGRKQDLYEGGIREPFIACWPGRIKAGTVSDHISAQFDLMATLAEISGVKPPSNDGISFLAALTGKQQQQHPYLYFEFPEKGGQVAVRMGRWKGVRSDMKRNPASPWEIFDLQTDPAETTDLASRHPELVKQFDEILRKEHRCAHIREWEFVDPKFTVK